VFEYVSGPGAFLNAFQKSTRLPIAATVLMQAGKAFAKTIVKPRD
jgi:hypothetical protein